MFRDADSRYMHWTLQAILNWDPQPLLGVRVLPDSRRPRLLDSRPPRRSRLRFPDGGHMINVTHAEEVNAFVRRASNA